MQPTLASTHFTPTNSSEKHHIPRLTLGAYCMFCAVLSYALTLWLLFEKEVRLQARLTLYYF